MGCQGDRSQRGRLSGGLCATALEVLEGKGRFGLARTDRYACWLDHACVAGAECNGLAFRRWGRSGGSTAVSCGGQRCARSGRRASAGNATGRRRDTAGSCRGDRCCRRRGRPGAAGGRSARGARGTQRRRLQRRRPHVRSPQRRVRSHLHHVSRLRRRLRRRPRPRLQRLRRSRGNHRRLRRAASKGS